MKFCPKCSTEFEDKFNFCRLDGTSLQQKALAKPCPGCGKETEEGKKFCRHCGAKYESDPEKPDHLVNQSCPQCGKEVEAGKKFCRHCGARVESSTEAAPRKVGTPNVEQVINQPHIQPELPKPATEEKAAEKIESQAIQRQEAAQQPLREYESPTEAAERYLKENNFKDAIAVLEPCVKNSSGDQETYLLHLLASIKLYNIYGYEKQIESLKSLSNLTEKERGIAREIFLIRSEEARNRGQVDEAREYQRLASRVILGQPLTEPPARAKTDEPPMHEEEVKPFPERKVDRIPQTTAIAIPSVRENIALPP